jgi:16S rRNA pseudouridine516 synthase
MFHRVGCRVAVLHRESVGGLSLPDDLKPGDWRTMTPREVETALRCTPHA